MSKPEVPPPEVGIECSHTRMADVAELVENPRNPNKHPASQIELLAKIIANQGWRSPIVVSKRSGFIVKGHGRYQAALKLGLDQVPIDEQEYESEAKEWADMIADNRLAELAEIGRSELKDLLGDLDDGSFDMDMTGFLENDLAEMMSEFNPYSEIAEVSGAGPTMQEAKAGYEESVIRQIMLIYPAEEYDAVIDAMGQYAEQNGLSNNTEVVNHLLETNGYAISQRQ